MKKVDFFNTIFPDATSKTYAQLIAVEREEEELNTDTLWLKNELYQLKYEDNYILLSITAWLNDSIMDAAQIPLGKGSWY